MAWYRRQYSKPINITLFAGVILGLLFLISQFYFQFFEKKQLVTLSGRTMGTTYHVKYIDDKAPYSSQVIHTKIDDYLKQVNQEMSTFIPTSEISQFNQFREINTPFPISKDFALVVKTAIDLNNITQGALDVTVGPLVNIWSFGPTKRYDKAPTDTQIQQIKQIVGIEKLRVMQKGEQYYLEKTVPELYVDLSAIAKGFGVDKIANYLASLGIQNYMVEIGGEIFAQGKNDRNVPWEIGIEDPQYNGGRAVKTVVGLSGKGMATSGDYRNYFEENGKRFSHEIDPTTGYPVQHHLASITVIAPNTMLADGLSTGLFVLGEEKALQVAEAQHLAVYLIIKQGDKFMAKSSSAFQQLIHKE